MSQAEELVVDALCVTRGTELLQGVSEASPWTGEHCKEVGNMVIGAAAVFDFEVDDIAALSFGGTLHDVGKIHPAILPLIESSDIFTPEQRLVVGKHATFGGTKIRELAHNTNDRDTRQIVSRGAFMADNHHAELSKLANATRYTGARSIDCALTLILQLSDVTHALKDKNRPYRLPASDQEAKYILEKKFGGIIIKKRPILDAVDVLLGYSSEQRALVKV